MNSAIGDQSVTSPDVTVYFDYVCPYCLLAEEIITTTAAEFHAVVSWHPFELRPAPNPTLRTEDDYLPRVWRTSVYPMAEQLGVDIALPRVSPQPYTHLAFEGAQYARTQGLADRYHGAVLRAFFQQDRDIGAPEVLRDIAGDVGLDSGEFAAALQQRRYAETHRDELAASYAAGVRAVPTVVIGSQRFEGVPDRAQLRTALRAEHAPDRSTG